VNAVRIHGLRPPIDAESFDWNHMLVNCRRFFAKVPTYGKEVQEILGLSIFSTLLIMFDTRGLI
jgi:hypothetical protein